MGNSLVYFSYIDKMDRSVNHHYNLRDAKSPLWNFASLDDKEQLDTLAKTLGFTYKLVEEKPDGRLPGKGVIRFYELDKTIVNETSGGFWSLDDVPEGYKPITALSNGSLVTCYFYNDGEVIHFMRPNPNAKDVYKPLDIVEHIKHIKQYGTY